MGNFYIFDTCALLHLEVLKAICQVCSYYIIIWGPISYIKY